MRLWHKELITVLPNKWLVAQWRELLAVKGAIIKKGTPNHPLVNFVLDFSIRDFKQYSELIYFEMLHRNMKPSNIKRQSIQEWECDKFVGEYKGVYESKFDKRYMKQCYYNLEEKADCNMMPSTEFNMIRQEYLRYMERIEEYE